jgi:hypothetical protein
MDTLMPLVMSIFPLSNMLEVCKVCLTFKKCNITLRILDYGMVANTIHEDYKLGENTTMEAINHFNIGI